MLLFFVLLLLLLVHLVLARNRIVLLELELGGTKLLLVLADIVSMPLAGAILRACRYEANEFILCHSGGSIAEVAAGVKALTY